MRRARGCHVGLLLVRIQHKRSRPLPPLVVFIPHAARISRFARSQLLSDSHSRETQKVVFEVLFLSFGCSFTARLCVLKRSMQAEANLTLESELLRYQKVASAVIVFF
jgi:hypothetical protein